MDPRGFFKKIIPFHFVKIIADLGDILDSSSAIFYEWYLLTIIPKMESGSLKGLLQLTLVDQR